MPYKDKLKQKEYKKRWNKAFYESNKTAEKERVKTRKKKIAKWFSEYRSNCSCEVCGENSPACLDFHHRDSEQKDKSLSNAVLVWV